MCAQTFAEHAHGDVDPAREPVAFRRRPTDHLRRIIHTQAVHTRHGGYRAGGRIRWNRHGGVGDPSVQTSGLHIRARR